MVPFWTEVYGSFVLFLLVIPRAQTFPSLRSISGNYYISCERSASTSKQYTKYTLGTNIIIIIIVRFVVVRLLIYSNFIRHL